MNFTVLVVNVKRRKDPLQKGHNFVASQIWALKPSSAVKNDTIQMYVCVSVRVFQILLDSIKYY